MNVPVTLFRKSQRFDSVGTLGACSPDRLVGNHAVEARVEGDLDDITIRIDDLYRRVIRLIGPLVLEPDSGFRHDQRCEAGFVIGQSSERSRLSESTVQRSLPGLVGAAC